ncbi:DNA replication complex GINS protein PSF3 isoform X2 [Bubalus kerabau]|uniref:DNA replication complex GINS protein PSF3 isoform X2 n=1 Tax=Bubalus bubalis TaxID=89462 RepID=UPI00042CA741|nr:DNA replication complex GINS protein PSF3 isoform X2 [Bubalus bubalis]XP_055408562.1 DNA replication complex GINS protein PSF3 isoform X2 [Bubalus carabanensis]
MSEAYFRVESGALGPEENFLSLDDILMSHEKLSVRTEIPMPRLGAFFLDRSGGAETDNAIPETFVGRFRRIMDSSQNAYNEDTSALVAGLDEMERSLFQTGQKGLNDFQCWEKGQASQLTASNLVQNYAKRKFTDMED